MIHLLHCFYCSFSSRKKPSCLAGKPSFSLVAALVPAPASLNLVESPSLRHQPTSVEAGEEGEEGLMITWWTLDERRRERATTHTLPLCPMGKRRRRRTVLPDGVVWYQTGITEAEHLSTKMRLGSAWISCFVAKYCRYIYTYTYIYIFLGRLEHPTAEQKCGNAWGDGGKGEEKCPLCIAQQAAQEMVTN